MAPEGFRDRLFEGRDGIEPECCGAFYSITAHLRSQVPDRGMYSVRPGLARRLYLLLLSLQFNHKAGPFKK